MKANPGGTIKGEAILGREKEIGEIWDTLNKRSVILTAERRVGKTCVLRKMSEHPRDGWIPFVCWVEKVNHPAGCVKEIYDKASRMNIQSGKGKWLSRFHLACQTLAGTESMGWKVPAFRDAWKRLLTSLIEDIAKNTDKRIVVMLDEFPMMISNIIHANKGGASLAIEFLNTLRALRQEFQPSDKIRFLLSGSIGLHLILEDLRTNHAYTGNPTADMTPITLSGMREEDVQLMCSKYLEEENIRRVNPNDFDKQMYLSTDGLPLYIQYVCERFQSARLPEVSVNNIDREIRAMMDNPDVQWFSSAAKRIDDYYTVLKANHLANHILNMLSHEKDFVPEKDIIDYVRIQTTLEHDDDVLSTLALLINDNYLVRDTSGGERTYRFRYGIMRRWWEINKG